MITLEPPSPAALRRTTAGRTGRERRSELGGSGNIEQYQRVALGSFSARSGGFVSGVLWAPTLFDIVMTLKRYEGGLVLSMNKHLHIGS